MLLLDAASGAQDPGRDEISATVGFNGSHRLGRVVEIVRAGEALKNVRDLEAVTDAHRKEAEEIVKATEAYRNGDSVERSALCKAARRAADQPLKDARKVLRKLNVLTTLRNTLLGFFDEGELPKNWYNVNQGMDKCLVSALEGEFGTRVHLAYAILNPVAVEVSEEEQHNGIRRGKFTILRNAVAESEIKYFQNRFGKGFFDQCPAVSARLCPPGTHGLPQDGQDHVFIADGCHRTAMAMDGKFPLLAALAFHDKGAVPEDEFELVLHHWDLSKEDQTRADDGSDDLKPSRYVKRFKSEFAQYREKQ